VAAWNALPVEEQERIIGLENLGDGKAPARQGSPGSLTIGSLKGAPGDG
jgi:hypothetical protein